METSYSKYQLWSPPALDLSLDSFSNDLFQEFDKTRTNIDTIGNKQVTPIASLDKEPNTNTETKHDQNEELNTVFVESSHQNDTLSTPDPSSVTVPSSERETSLHDEDFSSTTSLFRKSSTFLKKKLSQNGGSNKKDEVCSIQTNAEDITNIVSRQYPPKPLQYSPVVEPSASNPTSILSEASQVESTQNTRDVDNRSSTVQSHNRNSINSKRASNPISLASNSTSDNSPTSLPAATRAITTSAAATSVSTPKRRSFFSLRFC